MDGSSQEDEDFKSNMDEYKTKSTKWTDHPKGENNLQSPQSGRITQRVKIIYIVHKVDGSPKG